MKVQIIQKTAELHFKYGIKNVTMDQIANELCISKKTIYQNFSNKLELVKQVIDYIFEQVQTQIDQVYLMKLNPYEELMMIESIIKEMLDKFRYPPHLQLKKYYPEIAKNLEEKKFASMMEFLEHNLKKGIKLEYYKKDLNIEFVKRLFYAGSMSVIDEHIFPSELFDKKQTMNYFYSFFMTSISTKKGRKKLKEIIRKTKK